MAVPANRAGQVAEIVPNQEPPMKAHEDEEEGSWAQRREPQGTNSKGDGSKEKDITDFRSKFMKYPATRPGMAFACGCGAHCTCILIFLILASALGSDFFGFALTPAMHLWENEWKIGADALVEAQDVCNWDPLLNVDQKQQEFQTIPEGTKKYEIDIVYVADTGNMLTVDKLNRAKEFENKIVNHADYPKFCLRAPGTTECAAPITVVQACIPQLCGSRNDLASASQTCPSAANCDSPKSYPVGLFQCTSRAGCSRDQWTIDQAFLTQKVDQLSAAQFWKDWPETEGISLMEAGFGGGSSVSSAITSKIRFGFPLAGYTTVSDNAKEQVEKIEKFMKDAYFEDLDSFNDKHSKDAGFKLGYSGGNLMDASTMKLLSSEMIWVVLAFVSVWIYVSLMAQSLWFANIAMAQIFFCFLSGYIIYRIFWGSAFFSLFHLMAIFLIMGVGVDDVFVFLDHYEAALAVDERMHSDVWARLSWTWKHAITAMGVTSLTTIVSFLMNSSSDIPGIASFGVFAACLVMANYTSMVMYFPSVVGFNEKNFKPKPFLCGLWDLGQKCAANTSTDIRRRMSSNKVHVRSASGEEEEQLINTIKEKPALVYFFEHTFSRFILAHRIKIVLVFIGVSIFMCTQVAKLAPAREEPVPIPDDHPISQYVNAMKSKFVRGGGIFNTKVTFVFGFDRKPLDRDGTDSTGIGELGKIKWNPNWYTDAAMTQTNLPVIMAGFDCVIQLCDAVEVANAELTTGGRGYEAKGCWLRDLKSYVIRTTSQTEWDAIVAGDGAKFTLHMNQLEASNPKFVTDVREYAFAENINNAPFYRFFTFDITLTSSLNLDYNTGISVADAWKTWLQTQEQRGSCGSVSSTFWANLVSPNFHQFHVSKVLINDMFTGIITSIGVAFCVLILATGNILVGIYAACSIGLIVLWVMAMVPIQNWELGGPETISLVMVPGLSVDYVAHLAEAYIGIKHDDRENRVIHMLEHSGVSVISGAISTLLASICLLLCKITYFGKFGMFIFLCVVFSVLFSLFFFPSVLALIGPKGEDGDWHRFIHPSLQRENAGVLINSETGARLTKRGSTLQPQDDKKRCYQCKCFGMASTKHEGEA